MNKKLDLLQQEYMHKHELIFETTTVSTTEKLISNKWFDEHLIETVYCIHLKL